MTQGDDRATEAKPAVLDPDDPSKPASPKELSKPTWFGILKRSFTEFKDDNCTDWAAALTYYGVLSLFPALIVIVSLVGVFGSGERTVDTLMDLVRQIGQGSTVDALEQPINQVVNSKGAGALLSVGLLAALWSASGYIGAFMRASNAIYEVEEGRKFYKLRPLQLVITLVSLVAVSLIGAGLVVSGPVARSIGDVIGAGSGAVTVWNIAKWPVLIILASLLLSLLYWIAPNVKQPKFKWFTIGGLVALVVWILASAAFGFYVANFGSYNKTYGSLGAIIGFLVWLWITNCAILFGAEINAEMERGRELQAGHPAEEELLLPPRDPADDDSAKGKAPEARAADDREDARRG